MTRPRFKVGDSVQIKKDPTDAWLVIKVSKVISAVAHSPYRFMYTDGERACRWLPYEWFSCDGCHRKVCYCGGHDSGDLDCEDYCDDCCPGHTKASYPNWSGISPS